MNNEHSTTYFQRIWQKIKRVLSEPEKIVATEFFISNENDKSKYRCPSKKPKLDIVAKSIQDSFDQGAFMEVMKKLLTCSVCLEVRKQANQCQNGHLICINCTLCLQQSSSTKKINCPVCRVPLSGYYQRSLLAEQLVCELPTKCRFCSSTMSIRQLQQHESDICSSRTINCQYALFGCSWKGEAKQRKNHESMCNVGLSTVALASDTVHLNLKNQLNYYEKRNSQWQNTVNKLRERNNGMKIFMKHLVLTRYKDQSLVKSSFKTTKLEIFRNQFELKFNIINDKKSSNHSMLYKLTYLSKQNLNVNFFLHSIRYDDETFELDDNLHYHPFSGDEQNTGSYSLHFSGTKLENSACLLDTLALKDSLYLEIVLMIDSNESLDCANPNNSQLETSDPLSQAITNSRSGSNSAGNLVVALISSNSQPNDGYEVETEEVYDNDDDMEEEGTDEEEAEDRGVDDDQEAEEDEMDADQEVEDGVVDDEQEAEEEYLDEEQEVEEDETEEGVEDEENDEDQEHEERRDIKTSEEISKEVI